jgi:pimeloyl-ACP methyl ester carboxylesterase
VIGLATLLAACVIGSVNAQCGSVTVPENRALPDGTQISLRVAVLPATDKAHRRPDPLFFVTGGPGGVDYDEVPSVAGAFAAENAHRDIVFVDQRGVGGSNPLACAISTQTADLGALVRDCLGQVTADVTHYRTIDAVDDLEAVRRALGYGAIDVYGGSYGATLAQVYLRRYPASIRTLVLDGATLLDVPVFSAGRRAGSGRSSSSTAAAGPPTTAARLSRTGSSGSRRCSRASRTGRSGVSTQRRSRAPCTS